MLIPCIIFANEIVNEYVNFKALYEKGNGRNFEGNEI